MGQVATYPEDDQHARWKRNADALGLSLSEYVEMMVEAGTKNFTARVERDESAAELRDQRNDLRGEVQRLRTRVETLEDRLYGGEREAILTFIEEHGPVREDRIVAHVVESANQRVPTVLDSFEADGYLEYSTDGYDRTDAAFGDAE